MKLTRYSQILTILIYSLITFHFFYEADLPSLFFLNILQTLRMLTLRLNKPLNVLSVVSFTFLFLAPSLALELLYRRNTFWIVALFIAFVDILRFSDFENKKYDAVTSNKTLTSRPHLVFIMISLSLAGSLGLIMPESILSSFISFTLPYCVAVYFFEQMLRRGSHLTSIIIALSTFILIFIVYLKFYWSGFGRLNIGVILMLPFALTFIYRDIAARAWHIILMAPFALTLAALSRYGAIPIEKIFVGSAGHHLIITDDFLKAAPGWEAANIYGFIDQMKLLLFNWVPRNIWENKPVGVGYSSVDDWFGRIGVAENYTVSIGMFGETIYFLGGYFLFGNIVIAGIIFFLRRTIIHFSTTYRAPLVIFDINLLSYVWGGCAVFGSRVWFFLIPSLLLCMYASRLRSQKPSPKLKLRPNFKTEAHNSK